MIINKYSGYLIRFIAVTTLLLLTCSFGYAQNPEGNEEQILSSVESLFKAMKDKQYREIWLLLTDKTKESIIESVVKTSAKSAYPLTAESTRGDFQTGGPSAQAYWDAYIANFNPDMVLQQSTWKLGKIKNNDAELIIQYRKAERPAVFKLKKEGGFWKTGLEETFGILKWILK